VKTVQRDATAIGLARPATTRRQAVALMAGAAAALFGGLPDIGAKKKRKKNKSTGGGLSKPAHVAIGVYMPRALDDAKVMNGLKASLGRSPDYVTWYETWSNGNFNEGHRRYLRTVDEHNLTAVISWDPYDPKGHAVNQSQYKLSNIYGGNFNGYIDSWAEGLADYGEPVFLNFAHEMNGDWFPWGVGVNGNSKTDFVQAWRHIHERFRRAGANNVRWVWMPNKVYDAIPASLQDVYPGDNYVDWFGMNGYNWGTSVYWESCPCQSKWESFSKVFDETYRQLSDIGNQPIMIGETASSDKSGKNKGKKGRKKGKKGKKKANWIRQAMLSALPNSYPNVRAFTWFNAKATGLDTDKKGKVVKTAAVDWRFTSSKKARKAFSGAAKNTYYSDSLRNM
jgi:mannan endo-1,4-beta-mannosidase